MPSSQNAYFRGAFESARDEDLRLGKRPVIFDILAPDRSTSLLPDDLKLVLHVNPSTMQLTYAKQIERNRTRGGFVEYHWGDAAEEATFTAATGGFVRLYTGLSATTGSGSGAQSRRQTLAYQKFLNLLALFHWNGAIYDRNGLIVLQGYVKMTFDGGVHIGWFDGDFTVTESADKPYQFELSAKFIIDQEIMTFRTTNLNQETGLVVPSEGGLPQTPEMTVTQMDGPAQDITPPEQQAMNTMRALETQPAETVLPDDNPLPSIDDL